MLCGCVSVSVAKGCAYHTCFCQLTQNFWKRKQKEIENNAREKVKGSRALGGEKIIHFLGVRDLHTVTQHTIRRLSSEVYL